VKNHKKEQEMGTFTIYFITWNSVTLGQSAVPDFKYRI
jgi:hypothetical protein